MENQKFISKFFGSQAGYFQGLSEEIMDANSDESIVAKIADYVEVTHYKFYMGMFTEYETNLVKNSLQNKIGKIKDPITKSEMEKFIEQWVGELPGKNTLEIISGK